jgi:dipeptidyl aminopeptidase/acylaminoacyl peptidase
VTSVAWAPDGRRLAFTQAELGGRAVGLHVLDVATGSTLQIPVLRSRAPAATRMDAVLRRFVTEQLHVLGCTFPTDVAWAPDGVRLAYSCQLQGGRSGIFVIEADGSHRISVRTGVANAVEPTWSPDGRRSAFVTAPVTGSGANGTTSQVFVVDLDGTHRTLIARHATAPAWSPNGRTIAYWELSDCGGGIRLATPAGRDVTPFMTAARCRAIGSPGMPVWSPDGRKIAIGTTYGVDVINADGSHNRQVLRESGRGAFGDSRPNWGPNPTGDTVSRHLRPNCPSCNSDGSDRNEPETGNDCRRVRRGRRRACLRAFGDARNPKREQRNDRLQPVPLRQQPGPQGDLGRQPGLSGLRQVTHARRTTSTMIPPGHPAARGWSSRVALLRVFRSATHGSRSGPSSRMAPGSAT